MSYSKLVFKNVFILKLILQNTSAAVSMGGDALFPPLGALVSQGPIRSTAAPVYGLGGVCWMHVCAHYVRYVRDMEMRAPASYAELWWKYDDMF